MIDLIEKRYDFFSFSKSLLAAALGIFTILKIKFVQITNWNRFAFGVMKKSTASMFRCKSAHTHTFTIDGF